MRLSCNFVNVYTKRLPNVYTNMADNNITVMILTSLSVTIGYNIITSNGRSRL